LHRLIQDLTGARPSSNRINQTIAERLVSDAGIAQRRADLPPGNFARLRNGPR